MCPGYNIIIYRYYLHVDLKSENSDTTLNITFVNMSSSPIDVVWIDFAGNEIVYSSSLAVGDEYEVNTYFTHPWIFKSSIDTRTKIVARANDYVETIFEASDFDLSPNSRVKVDIIDGMTL